MRSIIIFLFTAVFSCFALADDWEDAAKQGDIDRLEQLRLSDGAGNKLEERSSRISELAAYNGRASVLEWLNQRGCFPKAIRQQAVLWVLAAGGGHVSVLDWLEQNRIPQGRLHTGEADLINIARRAGHLQVIAWLESRQRPPPGRFVVEIDEQDRVTAIRLPQAVAAAFHAALAAAHGASRSGN